MAISLTNHLVLISSCQENYPVWDKAAKIDPYLPWADMVLGALACLIGVLAMHGIIPMSGGSALVTVATLQIFVALIIKCTLCCKLGVHAARSALQPRAATAASTDVATATSAGTSAT
jgi:hypothetical protein